MLVYVYMCSYVCVCVRERGRERKRERVHVCAHTWHTCGVRGQLVEIDVLL